MLKPWGRRPGESDRDYALFISYRDQPIPRDLRRVTYARTIVPSQEAGELAKVFAWAERARAYDEHMAHIREEARAEVARYSAAERQAATERLAAISGQFVERELLKLLAASLANEGPVIKPEALLAKVPDVIKSQRLLAGETTENTSGPNPFEGLSVEQLRAIDAILAEKEGGLK
jgi:hypothetical protein